MTTTVEPMSVMKKCAVPGCTGILGGDQVFCMPHWGRIPSEIQERLVDAYRPGKMDMGMPTPLWDMALAQAINILGVTKK